MLIYFNTQIDEKTNHVTLSLNEPHKLSFSNENPVFQELKDILIKLGEGHSVTLNYGQDHGDFSSFDTLIQYLSDEKLVCHLRVDGGKEEDKARNKLLDNFYRHALRKKQLNPDSITAINELFQAPPKPSGKVRRAKQLLNRGIRLHTQTQHQHQHHKEHGVQQEKQKERQAEKQQAQNRQNQVQQQQQRMQATQKQLEDVNVGALGKLIHAGNLQELVDETLNLDTIKAIWTNLVGAHAARVENPENRITHVPEDTFRLIIKHKEQFSYGVQLDDLAHGFGFTVHKNAKEEPLSILYFDKKLLQGKRKDSFLAARLDDEKLSLEDFKEVGQFYPFFDGKEVKSQENYASFIKKHEAAFKHLFHPEKSTKTSTRIAALIQLMILDTPELTADVLQEHLKDFSDANLDGLRTILLEKGSPGVLLLLSKLRQLKQANQYDSFKNYFMDSSSDWRALLETATTREGELNAPDAIDYLCSMPAEERLWWNTMMDQHVKANPKTNLIDLVNAHRYFFAQVKAMEPPITLPPECPLTNINNMKTAYSRLLFLLNKAIDPQEQARYLSKLDFGMQGFICAVRKEPYVLITKDMDITPGKKTYFKTGVFRVSVDPFTVGAKKFSSQAKCSHCMVFFHDSLTFFYYEKENGATCLIESKPTITDNNRVDYERLKQSFPESNGLLTNQIDNTQRALIQSFINTPIFNKGRSQAEEKSDLSIIKNLGYNSSYYGLKDLSTKLDYFANLIKYFYRVIGTETFAYPFSTYQALVGQLDTAVLHKEETKQVALQKDLLALLAILSTGRRVLKEERDILSDWNQLVTYIQKHAEEVTKTGLFQKLFLKLIVAFPKPTLFEFTSLLHLTHDIDFITDILCGDVDADVDIDELDEDIDDNELIYKPITHLAQFNEQPDTKELKFFLTFIRKCPNEQRQTVSLLGSLTRKEDWPLLSSLNDAVNTIKNTEVKTHLHTLIGKINFNDSRPASIAEISELIKQLAMIPEDDNEAYINTLGLMKQCLPSIKLQDSDLSSSFAFFIRQLVPFASSLKELVSKLKEILGGLDEMIESNLGKVNLKQYPLLKPETIKSYAGNIKEFAEGFLEKVTSRVDALSDALSEIKAEDSTEKIKDVLKKIRDLLGLLDDPLKDLSLGDGFLDKLATTVLRVTLNSLVIEPAKTQVLKLLSENLLGPLCLQLSDSVLKLKINDAVLDKAGEAKTSLSSVLNDFLIARLPALHGKDITGEINAALKAYDEGSAFVESLQRLPKGAVRDELLALLYRQGIFTETKTNIPLSELTTLLKEFHRCEGISLAASFEVILDAHRNKISLDNIKGLIQQLTSHVEALSNAQFQALLSIGLTAPKRLPLVSQLVGLQVLLHKKNSRATQTAFIRLLNLASKSSIEETRNALTACKKLLEGNDIEAISGYIVRVLKEEKEEQGIDELLQLATLLNNLNDETRSNAVIILQASCWENAEEDSTSTARQSQLITTLQTKHPEGLKKLAELYKTRPAPAFSALETALTQEDFNLEQWLKDYELDPHGKRASIAAHFELRGLASFVAEIKDLRSGKAVSGAFQEKLIDAASYLLAVADQYGLPINNQIKPIREFSRAEINSYYQTCMERVKKNPADIKAKIEGLALLSESYFRATGKYPYQSQLVSVLSTLFSEGSTLLQIQTGQGKSATLALIAAMTHSFGEEGTHTSVLSRNRILTQRDFEESRDFFAYLDIPVAFVTSETERNHYEKPTVMYTTTSDKSLYDSRLKLVNNVSFPENQVAVCDEVDAEFFDNKNAFNFSESNEDPYLNPLEWIYPLANEFIEGATFTNEGVFEEEDIRLFLNHVKEKDEQKYQQFKAKLTKAKVNQLLDGACAAKQLLPNTDFIIRKRTREVRGVLETISEAHLLVNHMEDKEATLSHGVQQALHARLNKEHQQEVARFKSTKGQEGTPPFSCDNVIDCVDSQNSHSVLKRFKRLIGATGTAGTKAELDEVASTLNIKTMLDIPPRRKSRLAYLPTVFAEKETSFFFGKRTQLDSIQRALKRAKDQPVMISAASIDQANDFAKALNDAFPGKVQLIHAENADDPAVFEDLVAKASTPGQITIVTPLAGRGVDIKTTKAREGETHKLALLAEKLLVIETNLERYRNRRQLQGRSARDGKAGQTVGIFDLEDILKQHGCDLKPLSQDDKLKALDALMDKMDAEASLERQISSKVGGLINGYEAVFDGWIKTHHSNSAHREQLIAAKAAFIETCEQVWNEGLANSDPEGRYENPYVRYNQDGHLEREVFETLVTEFETALKTVHFPACKDAITIELETPDEVKATYDYTPTVEEEPANPEPTPKAPDIPTPSQDEAYLKFNKGDTEETDSNHQRYLQALALKEQFDRQVKIWITDNPKASAFVKGVATRQQASILQHLRSKDGREVYAFPVAVLHSVTETLQQTRELTESHAGQWLAFYALAFYEINAGVQDEKALCEAMLAFLDKALALTLKDPQDQASLQRVSEDIKAFQNEGRMVRLLDLHHVVSKRLSVAEDVIQSPATNDYLHQIKQVINALVFKTSSPTVTAEDAASLPQNDFKIMALGVKRFLERHVERMQSTAYKRLHRFANDKREKLEQFLTTFCSDEALKQFIEGNKLKTVSELFQSFIKQGEGLESILATTTRRNKPGKTTSLNEFKHLLKRFEKEFPLDATEHSSATAYLKRLETIAKNLENRKKNAGFLKNAALYDKKIEKLNLYIDKVKDLITKKDSMNVADVDNEIRLIQHYVENDPDLYRSTARFFQLERNVTIVKDIKEAAKELLKKP